MAIADRLHKIAVELNATNNAVTDEEEVTTVPSLPRKGGTIVDEMLNIIYAADAENYSSAGISTIEDAVLPLVEALTGAD